MNRLKLKKYLMGIALGLTVSLNLSAEMMDYSSKLSYLKTTLSEFRLIRSREIVRSMLQSKLTPDQWLETRQVIHKYPQIGLDILLIFDRGSPLDLNDVDLLIKKLDNDMLSEKFKEAAAGYQEVIKLITKKRNFKNGPNYHLYWSLIHSLARAYYGLKQYDEAFVLYRTIPSAYPFYKQVQFELMWNNYKNNRLEYALGAIATMSSGHFSAMLDPEVYLVQYYIYRRMCRNEEVEVIKNRVKFYNDSLKKYKYPLTSWIKKDVETLVYNQVLRSGDLKSVESTKLRIALANRMMFDVKRIQKEFELVNAHLEVDSGKNKNLKPVNNLLSVDQLLSTKNEKWKVDDNEIWADELGKQVFIQRELCSKETPK